MNGACPKHAFKTQKCQGFIQMFNQLTKNCYAALHICLNETNRNWTKRLLSSYSLPEARCELIQIERMLLLFFEEIKRAKLPSFRLYSFSFVDTVSQE